MFKVEYQYDCWKGRVDEGSSRWWIESDRVFKSKKKLVEFVDSMNSKYSHILFRQKLETTMDKSTMKGSDRMVIYTDGSAYHKDRVGGIGIYITYKGEEWCLSRGYKNTTNNRMELRAVIESMKLIEDKSIPVTIYSDSEYVINIFNSWLFNWESEGFVDKKNVDLLKQACIEYRKFLDIDNIEFVWCKGHSGIEGNELADMLAGEGRSGNEHVMCMVDGG